MSDSEQCSNRLELDLISLLVNFACELEQIMNRLYMTSYGLDDWFWAPTRTWHTGTGVISLLVNFSCDLGQMMTRYDFLLARRVILNNVRTDSQLDLILLVNFSCELGQIMTRYDCLGLDEWFWAMFKLTPTLPIFRFCSTYHMNWGKEVDLLRKKSKVELII